MLLERDHAVAKQAFAESVDHLIGAREDHLTAVDIDGLLVRRVFEEEKTRLARGMDQVEHVRDGKRAHVRDQDQITVPGQGRRVTVEALEDDGPPACCREQPDRIIGAEPEPFALFRGEQRLAPRPLLGHTSPLSGFDSPRHSPSQDAESPTLFDPHGSALEAPGRFPRVAGGRAMVGTRAAAIPPANGRPR